MKNQRKRILMAGFHLESNTSNPVPVTEADFRILSPSELLLHFPDAVSAITNAGCEVLPSIYAESLCVAAGVLELASYRSIAERIIADVPLDGNVDGVWLYLHGSMQVEFIGSGEAFLVSAIRERVGPSIPIAVAMDFHGNMSHTLARCANIIVGYRTAPHTDIAQTQQIAAELVCRAAKENILPQTTLVRVPMLQPGEAATTDMPHVRRIMEMLDALDRRDGVWRSSFFTGMSWIDCPHNGSTLVVSGTGQNRSDLEAALIQNAQEIWEMRHAFRLSDNSFLPEEAIRKALSSPGKTVLLSDSGDNVTAGAVGDNALMLGLLLRVAAEHTLVAGIWDEVAVRLCAEAGEGAELTLRLGSRHDRNSQSVLLENARVLSLHRDVQGRADGAVLRTGGITVIVNAARCSFTGEQDLIDFGVSYHDYHVIVVKLGYLFPGLSAIADDSYIALTDGSAMLTISKFSYRNQRRPLYPFEDDFPYEAKSTLW